MPAGPGQGRYNNPAPTLVSGASAELQLDSRGRLLVNAQPVAAGWVNGGAAASEKVIVAAPTRFYNFIALNTGASTRYVFIFDVAVLGGSRPANGATSELIIPLAVDPGKAQSLRLANPRACANGLAVSASSTIGSFTYDAAATLVFSAECE